MRRKNRTHLALGLMLMAVIAGTCTVVYQSGSKNVPNEKEFVLNEGDSIDEAMKNRGKKKLRKKTGIQKHRIQNRRIQKHRM